MERCLLNTAPIGLIAGYGRYPVLLAETMKRNGLRVACLAVDGQYDPNLRKICDHFRAVGVARFGGGTRYFRSLGVREATMAGKFMKMNLFAPGALWRLIPDLYTIRIFSPHFFSGKKDNRDDSLLLAAVEAFERRGIKIVPGTDFAPELLMTKETLTKTQPTAAQWQDICFGWKLAREMGRLDIGQAVAVKNRCALAVEAIEGTDQMIRRAGTLCTKNNFVVVKISKPNQDMRFDVPTVGAGTIQTMHESGAKVLALEANKTILIDRDEVVQNAERFGISIVAVLEDDIALPNPFAGLVEV